MRLVVGVLLLAGCDQLFKIDDPQQPSDAHPIDSRVDSVDSAFDRGLVAHYTMDTLTMGIAADETTDHPGDCIAVNQECPTVIPGLIGGAYEFNGTTNRIQVPGGGDLETTDGFTVAGWIRIATPPAGFVCPFNKVVGVSGGDTWQLCIVPDLTLTFISTSTDSGNPGNQYTTTKIPTGAWVHIAITFDGVIQTILIGGAVASEYNSAPLVYDGSPIELGADLDGGNTNAVLDGDMDDVRIYNRALTSGEIAALATI